MNREIKLIAIDMDGTLLNEEKKISKRNIDTIKAVLDQKIHVVLCTGRPYSHAIEYAKALELTSYMVTANGALLLNNQGQVISKHLVDSEHIKLMSEMSLQSGSSYWALSTEELFRDNIPEHYQQLEWLKFGFIPKSKHSTKQIKNQLHAHGLFEITNTLPTNIEVNALGINKAFALKKICKELEIDMSQVMTIGNALNDLVMIKEAGLGIAVANAQEIVKEAADFITESNQESGVAVAIEKWILKTI
jgi:5-amino-6-(5-phospho-D-ribitylamino)uracil phosphatase